MFSFYENREYPEYELQDTYDLYLTPEQIDKVHSSGKLNQPYEGDLILTAET